MDSMRSPPVVHDAPSEIPGFDPSVHITDRFYTDKLLISYGITHLKQILQNNNYLSLASCGPSMYNFNFLGDSRALFIYVYLFN